MRLIHTADWHLGRIFYQVHLTDDQAYVLDQFVNLVKDSRPDAVVISGDIYDRAVPPTEAVELLDSVLSRLVLDLKTQVIVIAGNHDSPQRIGFASRLLSEQGLHLAGELSPEPYTIVLNDKNGPVTIYVVPYTEPPMVRDRLGTDLARDHNSSMEAITSRIKAVHPSGERSVVVAHTFVVGGSVCESERPLSVGGAGAVDTRCFEGFDYVALGHLHRPQAVGGDHVHYAGSLLKYSFSEIDHTKSVSLVELDGKGLANVERIPLSSKRDLRCIEGHMEDILAAPGPPESRDDYVMITLLDKEPILDPMGKLRTVYPNVLHLERPLYEAAGSAGRLDVDHRSMDDSDLFALFFKEVTGDEITEKEAQAFREVVDEVRYREREAGT